MDVTYLLRFCLIVSLWDGAEVFATIDPTGQTRLYYDANGNVLQRSTPLFDNRYGYDVLDRLTHEDADGLITDRDYDANGNRLSESGAVDRSHRYQPASNRLGSIDDMAVEHDAAGNRVNDRDGARRFEYNAAGRLARVYENDVLIATYTYNALGQRTRKETPNGITLFHYDLRGHLIGETTESGQPIRDLIWMDNAPVAQITNDGTAEQLVYLHTDHLTTPRSATDHAQRTVWRWEVDAFGSSAAQEDPDNDGQVTQVMLRFPGQYHDAETGWYYNYFRYYEPDTGRYVTRTCSMGSDSIETADNV